MISRNRISAYVCDTASFYCNNIVEGYPIPVEDMAAADLNSLNESAKMIDQMSEMEIANLQMSLRGYLLEYESGLKDICEKILGPLTAMQNNLTM